MRITMQAVGCLAALALLSACQPVPQDQQMAAAATLSPEQYRARVTVYDDDLETIATLSTIDGYRPHRGLLDESWSDSFLRAFITKRTGRTSYQVYQTLYYHAYHMRRYDAASYQGLDGPRAAEVTVIDRDIICGRSRTDPCAYFETVGFDVDEALLRAIAQRGPPDHGLAWRFKFRARDGHEFATSLAPAEIAGLLTQVDAYKAARGLR